jgi:putative nucleotidyltransferase with HDIG domain
VARLQVSIEGLKLGMYVAELDRPWLDTPFLFQGFRLEREEDLEQIRKICRYVYVDVDLSSVPVPRSLAPKAAGSVRREDSGSTIATTTSPTVSSATADPDRFVVAAREAAARRQVTHDYLKRLFQDIRLGHSVDSDEAKSTVNALVDSITSHPDVSIWLTQMKNRDEYTSLHCLNVCVLTVAFCRHLGYSEDDLRTIGLGALMHDIGKSLTPQEILNKPGKLSREEWAIMKRHPEDGYQMMSKSGQIPAQALAIIRMHHLRRNGLGYPEPLRSEELNPLIFSVAIADVYDAMTSDRPYHQGLAADQVLRFMHKHADQTFGRDLMETFIQCVGIFPVGSLVELGNGSIGMVISTGRDARLLPRILLVRDAEGKAYPDRRLADLALLSRERDGDDWTVTRVISPSDYDIHPRELILSEIK